MPTAYEKAYGEVTFYDLAGTKIYAMTADLGLWLVEDTEPSPDPKWVRVDVPGADGAVDLSRALAGQVTYEMRDITLRFGGKCADHATALALVRTLRKALHGARARVETMLTGLAGGYYVADCECDGDADPEGIVTIDVRAQAEPFIRVGTQTLALAASPRTFEGPDPMLVPTSSVTRGAGSINAQFVGSAENPQGATSAHLWWAMGDNLFDVGRQTVRAFDGTTPVTPHASSVSGQTIYLGSVDGGNCSAEIVGSSRTSARVTMCGFPFVYEYAPSFYPSRRGVAVFLSGDITAVSSPSVYVTRYESTTIDASGHISAGTSTSSPSTAGTAVTTGSIADQLVYYCEIKAPSTSIVCRPIQAFVVTLSGITGTDVSLRVMVTEGGTAPTEWEPAALDYATVDFGGSWCCVGNRTDEATITYGKVVTTHNLVESGNPSVPVDASTPFETTGTVSGWPAQGATQMCLSAVNSYGDECATCVIDTVSYFIDTETATNQTMRSTPTVTSSGGMLLSIGGRDAIVAAGTQAVPSLTIPAGAFSVEYATFDYANATMTWEGGVL